MEIPESKRVPGPLPGNAWMKDPPRAHWITAMGNGSGVNPNAKRLLLRAAHHVLFNASLSPIRYCIPDNLTLPICLSHSSEKLVHNFVCIMWHATFLYCVGRLANEVDNDMK